MDYGSEQLYAMAAFLIAVAAVFGVVRARFSCASCGSWATRTKRERSLEWGTDVGGIVKTDPYFVRRKVRVCTHCGTSKVLSVTSQPVPEDESAYRRLRDDVLAHDFSAYK